MNPHDIGLLVPSEIDSSNGYFYYDHCSLERMKRILYLRLLRVPLSDIKYLLENSGDVWVSKIHQHLEHIRSEHDGIERIEKELIELEKRLLNGKDMFTIMEKKTEFSLSVFYLEHPLYVVGCTTDSIDYNSRKPKIDKLLSDYFGDDVPSMIQNHVKPIMRFGIVEETSSSPHEIQYIIGEQVQQEPDQVQLPSSLICHIIPAGNYACVTFSGLDHQTTIDTCLGEAYGEIFNKIAESAEWSFGKHICYEVYDLSRFEVPSWPEMDLWIPVNKKV